MEVKKAKSAFGVAGAGAVQVQRLIPQERALSENNSMSARGLTQPSARAADDRPRGAADLSAMKGEAASSNNATSF